MSFLPGGPVPVLEGWMRIIVAFVAVASVAIAVGLIIKGDVFGVAGVVGGLILGAEGFYLGRSALTGRWLLDAPEGETRSRRIGQSEGQRTSANRRDRRYP